MQQDFWGFLVVIVLTSPIQAAAEEIFFRGYLMQALGSLVARPWFGVVVSSVVFALLHGVQNLPLFVDRLAFGLLAALLVWRPAGSKPASPPTWSTTSAPTCSRVDHLDRRLKAIQSFGWVDAASTSEVSPCSPSSRTACRGCSSCGPASA